MLIDETRARLGRVWIMSLVVVAAMGVLLSRLYNVQIVNSESLKRRGEEQTTLRSRIAPARGSICDRNGIGLAENRPSFDIDFYLDQLSRDYAQGHNNNVPKLPLKDGKNGKKRYETDIVEIVKESIQPISQTLGLNGQLKEAEILEHFRTDPDLPYHYLTDLDFATVAQFTERNLGVRGIKISQNPVRQYTYGSFASHILGYVGKPDRQIEHRASDGTPYETIGQTGIEDIMDSQLQGQPGYTIERVSSQGYIMGEAAPMVQPTMGHTLYLTIDARVQYLAETAMRNSGWTRGAVVVMDPRNGDVLALASFPNYDPNKFIPRINEKDWDSLHSDATNPLINRALRGYEPGSTFKIMVALAGLKSGRVKAGTSFDCPAAIQIDDHLFHNSDRAPAGTMSLIDAIRVSSDVFFYQYGIRTGIENIDALGALCGFGHKWNLLSRSDEDAGILPGPEWMKQNAEWLEETHNINRWSNAQTANTSIGQGFVLTTPLQMATFLCAVANGGTVFQPRIYSHVEDYKGDTVAEIPAGTVYSTLDVAPRDLQSVQEGMRAVVEEAGGTANLTAKIPGYQLAGKTGTAQAYVRVDGARKQDLKTWFYCYGPYEAPRYVVTVMVEGGQWGGTAAAPIAAEIMKRLFAMEQGASENVAFLDPVMGNFKGVTDVEVHTDAPLAPAMPGGTAPVPIAPSASRGGDDSTDTLGDQAVSDAPASRSVPTSRRRN